MKRPIYLMLFAFMFIFTQMALATTGAERVDGDIALIWTNAESTDVLVKVLEPSWTAIDGGGVYSAYIGPTAYDYVSPGNVEIYDGRGAGIIKAGLTIDPIDGIYEDEGLFGFKPTVTIDTFASGTLTYDVETQYGENPVWMTIDIDTGVVGNRDDNTVYQFVPTSNPTGWHIVNAGAGQWQKWNNNNGDVTGNPLMSLSEIATEYTGLNVVRTYLRLGMGDSYHGTEGKGTIAWVDKATIGGVTYDFVTDSELNLPSPQQFSGPVTGDLAGTLSLTSNTDYDTTYTSIGTTWSDDVKLVLDDDTECLGFFSGSNVNQGRDQGTFSLLCDNGNIIQGIMYGVNDDKGNMNLKYSALVIKPIQGQKGDDGEQGIPGEDGTDGKDGADGKEGKNGIDGTNGTDGKDGVTGSQGLKGDTGSQGPQGNPGQQGQPGTPGLKGDQGIQGQKGDNGSDAVCTSCVADCNAYTNSQFSILDTYFDGQIQYLLGLIASAGYEDCNAQDTKTCSGDSVSTQDYYCKEGKGTDAKCILGKCELKTSSTSCAYGCLNGVCKPAVYESCDAKPHTTTCVNGNSVTTDYACHSGKGSNTQCLEGRCDAKTTTKTCNFGCLNGQCKAPSTWTESNCKSWCKDGNAIPASPCNTFSDARHYVNDHHYCVWA
jgi:hypothetical protein